MMRIPDSYIKNFLEFSVDCQLFEKNWQSTLVLEILENHVDSEEEKEKIKLIFNEYFNNRK